MKKKKETGWKYNGLPYSIGRQYSSLLSSITRCEIWYNVNFRQRHGCWLKQVHLQTNASVRWVSHQAKWSKFRFFYKSKMADGRHIEKPLNRHNSATVQRMAMKFGIMTHFNRSEFRYLKIQNGGQPPFWKNKKSPYLSDGLIDRHELLRDDDTHCNTLWTVLTVLKNQNFKNPRWWTATILKNR